MSTAANTSARPAWQYAAAHLLQGPVFEHDAERWRRVLQDQSTINGYFSQIGLRLIVDVVEGYAYLEQLPPEEAQDMPRLMRRRQLSLGATLYGLFLRQELDRMLKEDPSVARVRLTLRQIRELVAEFFPATNNESQDRRVAQGHIADLVELGFLRKVTDGEDGEPAYELTRLLRAKFNPAAAQELLDRIRQYLARRQSRHDPEPDTSAPV